MNRGVFGLLVAQFLSAFADNAILFVAIAMVLQGEYSGEWYIPALQSVFLVAFVVVAPWVGAFADSRSKPLVLIVGNLVKTLGIGLILLDVDPLIAYTIVGLGAAIYSPAKYGILPELVSSDELVKANGWIESSTIAAIILGTVAGGKVADYSISVALWMIVVSFLASIVATLIIPRIPPKGGQLRGALTTFVHTARQYLETPRARFSVLGTSLFWGASAVLRVLLAAWAPAVLAITSAGDISLLTLFLAVGVVLGAALVPRLIPLEQLRRARIAAFAMGVFILLFATVDSLWPARLTLFFIGLSGGIFVVPVNAALQEIGHATIGSGRAVAIQNFLENVAMLGCVGLYTLAAARGAHPVASLVVLGAAILLATIIISRRLPPGDPYRTAREGSLPVKGGDSG
ncbi:MAG TPA: lysophospholipid transporter LplT [Gammaproteobacteria bacterium]|nr:lysophospholipid transporter LplT [Gammaproteobacteria bacterium]